MPIGPGKYDIECTQAREAAQAAGCLLIIIAGKHGHGFSCQMTDEVAHHFRMADMLRDIAGQIDQTFKEDYEAHQQDRGNGDNDRGGSASGKTSAPTG